jgi:hypothetical protein
MAPRDPQGCPGAQQPAKKSPEFTLWIITGNQTWIKSVPGKGAEVTCETLDFATTFAINNFAVNEGWYCKHAAFYEVIKGH